MFVAQKTHTWEYTRRKNYKATYLPHRSVLWNLIWPDCASPFRQAWKIFISSLRPLQLYLPNAFNSASCGVKIDGVWLRAAFVFESSHNRWLVICVLPMIPLSQPVTAAVSLECSPDIWIDCIHGKAGVSLWRLHQGGNVNIPVWSVGTQCQAKCTLQTLSSCWPWWSISGIPALGWSIDARAQS